MSLSCIAASALQSNNLLANYPLRCKCIHVHGSVKTQVRGALTLPANHPVSGGLLVGGTESAFKGSSATTTGDGNTFFFTGTLTFERARKNFQPRMFIKPSGRNNEL